MFEGWIGDLEAMPVAADRSGLCDQLGGLARLRAGVDACEARLLAAVDELDDDGAPAAAVARSVGRCSQREADRRARRAETLQSLPSAADALAQGTLSVEHVDTLGRVVEETSVEAVLASDLVDRARRCPADLHAREARQWSRRHQRQGDIEARHRRRRAARRLSIFENDQGMTVLHGEFDPVTGRQISQAIGAEADRLFRLDGGRGRADQVRTSPQRRADALTELLVGDRRAGLARPRPPVGNQMLVLIHATNGEITDGHLVDGTPLPAHTIEHLACGSDLVALVLSSQGDPLWLGRRTRLATDGQWRALIARDSGCGICGADPSMCEAHHIVAWQPPGRGPTDIDNLLLLCRHHHHLVHDDHWKLVRTADGTWTLQPP